MSGYLALVLHAHLPFVRHPEHPRFLEENWLFEAITETYLPLLSVMQGWQRDRLASRLSLTLTPTLCSMLRDPLLQERFEKHLEGLLDLAEKEAHRTLLEKTLHELALFYEQRLLAARSAWRDSRGDLVAVFSELQRAGAIEIITSAATHAVLPLLASHRPSLRAQVLVARDHYEECFGTAPRGIWLPECAYCMELDDVLAEAGLRWFILDTPGMLHANPRPRYGMFAPVFTPVGVAAFGRDHDSARQVWSRYEGYPGDPRYRDFYRDVAFDLDYDYVRPHLAAEERSFTGIKYHRVTGGGAAREIYDRAAAMQAAASHAHHFVSSRKAQMTHLCALMGQAPIIVSPYDAELFGHWWFEGPEFLDQVVRAFAEEPGALITPGDYLRLHPTNQVAAPADSSWGEGGSLRVWLNESNHWIYPHLQMAQERMRELASAGPPDNPLAARALRQAGRELLLAQSSDWPFILRTGTSPDYARRRVKDHLFRFNQLYDQLKANSIKEPWLREIEDRDNIFPGLNCSYWAEPVPGEI